jgi:hypothetical protein
MKQWAATKVMKLMLGPPIGLLKRQRQKAAAQAQSSPQQRARTGLQLHGNDGFLLAWRCSTARRMGIAYAAQW